MISLIGFCVSLLDDELKAPVAGEILLTAELQGIQDRLFTMASVLADPRAPKSELDDAFENPAFRADHLEKMIDAADAELPELKHFILPGGPIASSALHLARAVCRRVERKATALAATEPVPVSALSYLNRLSDFLFIAARAVNFAANVPDRKWRQQEGMDD